MKRQSALTKRKRSEALNESAPALNPPTVVPVAVTNDAEEGDDDAECIFLSMKKLKGTCKMTTKIGEYSNTTTAKFDIDYLVAEKVLVKLRAEVKKNDDGDVGYTATASFGDKPGIALFNFINDGDGFMPTLTCSASACSALLESAGIVKFEVFSPGPEHGKAFCWPPADATARDSVLRLALTDILEQFNFDLCDVKRAIERGITDPGWDLDDPLVVAAIAAAKESDETTKPIRRGGKRYYFVAA
jgi:hypothetical protein